MPQNLLNDLSLTQFELEVQTGSAIPQSPMAIAQTTLQLANQCIFGDINNVDVKELILKSLDYPNYRAIIEKIKQEEAKMGEQPNEPEFGDYLKNVSLTLKDILGLIQNLSPNVQSEALYNISDSLGLTTGNPDMQEELPQGNFNVQFGENFANRVQEDPLTAQYSSTRSLGESL